VGDTQPARLKANPDNKRKALDEAIRLPTQLLSRRDPVVGALPHRPGSGRLEDHLVAPSSWRCCCFAYWGWSS